MGCDPHPLQAAVLAAEEASTAVNSSGPMEDPFGYAVNGDDTATAATAAGTSSVASPRARDSSDDASQDNTTGRANAGRTESFAPRARSRPSTAPAAVVF